jgi:membrane protein YdbS with pleckstrin-like domain
MNEGILLLITPVLITIIAALVHGKLPSWAKGVMWTLVVVMNLGVAAIFAYAILCLYALSGGNLFR